MSSPVAAIDCGTNSTRLLVTDGTRCLHREMTITRLGAGTSRSGLLDAEAVERTLETLVRYRRAMDDLGVSRVRVSATSAVRDARNRDLFLGPALEVVGAPVEVLDGVAEAELSFRGATAELSDATRPVLVVDIGGGSTEFALGSDRLEGAISVDMGSVRLTEEYLAGDPPAPEQLADCLAVVQGHLDDVLAAVPGAAGAGTVVGVAGTVTTVAAVELGLATYDRAALHHFVLTRAAAEDVFRTLATESLADRIHNPGLEVGRADVIVGGCCILVGIFRRLGLERMVVSEADILDGLAASILESDRG